MKFSELSKYLQKLEKTSSRNEMTSILATLFKKVNVSEIDNVCYLLLGRISPSYTGIEFNIAEKMVMRAISQAYGVDPTEVLRRYKEIGDLGNLVEKLKVKNAKLKVDTSIQEVYESLRKVAVDSGQGSQERKISGLASLLESTDSLSARYIVRIPVGKLRLGFSNMTILDALSFMKVGDKSAREKIEAVYNVTADIGRVAKTVKERGVGRSGKVNAIVGVPVVSSLADRIDSFEKIIEKLGPKVFVEPKLDGVRLQIHIQSKSRSKDGKQINIFSRNQENVTHMFPDIVKASRKLSVREAILDGEAIGVNPKTGKFVPFQETVQRKRKHKISDAVLRIPLKVFVFDILYLDGRTLIAEPFYKRRKVLEKILGDKSHDILVVEQREVDNPSSLKKISDGYLKVGLEGAIVKKINAAYQAGRRGFHWVKIKKHTEGGLFDTIDCVLMGAYRGRGKRTKFGVGGFLIGVVGESGRYYTISNLGTGLTDEQFKDMNKVVSRLKIPQKPKEYIVDKFTEPDIWVSPQIVLEILADEITVSPRHTAKLSLRFPRLIRVRQDKSPQQATTVSEIGKLYKMQ